MPDRQDKEAVSGMPQRHWEAEIVTRGQPTAGGGFTSAVGDSRSATCDQCWHRWSWADMPTPAGMPAGDRHAWVRDRPSRRGAPGFSCRASFALQHRLGQTQGRAAVTASRGQPTAGRGQQKCQWCDPLAGSGQRQAVLAWDAVATVPKCRGGTAGRQCRSPRGHAAVTMSRGRPTGRRGQRRSQRETPLTGKRRGHSRKAWADMRTPAR